MNEQAASPKKMEWKWIGITLIMYVILYPLPMIIARAALSVGAADTFIGGWFFGGIILIAAIAGFISNGVTLWEPAIAGAVFVVAACVFAIVATPSSVIPIGKVVLPTIGVALFFFILSLFGAWLGETAQKQWRKPKPAVPEAPPAV